MKNQPTKEEWIRIYNFVLFARANVSAERHNASVEALESLRLKALAGMHASKIEETETEIILTPAKAVEKVCARTQAAREENEKRVAKKMIQELTIKCEGYEATIEALRKELIEQNK